MQLNTTSDEKLENWSFSIVHHGSSIRHIFQNKSPRLLPTVRAEGSSSTFWGETVGDPEMEARCQNVEVWTKEERRKL